MSFGGANKCPKCGKAVYYAEQVVGPHGIKYHKMCMRCHTCNKGLDSGNLSEHDGTLYCTQCHKKEFGPKGYGFGVGAGIMSETTPAGPAANAAPQAQPVSSAPAEPKTTAPPAPAPAQPAEVKAPQPVRSVAQRTGGLWGQDKYAGKSIGGGGDKCGRCGKTVYAAEKVMGPGSVPYHKLCMKCADCRKGLDATSMVDHDNVPYCKACHGKRFGPKGFGFGALHDTGKHVQ